MKAIILDRDGIINEDYGYVYKTEDFVFKEGIFDLLQNVVKKEYAIFVVTNQSGIARGYYSEDDYLKLTAYMIDCMQEKGIHIEKVYYCPHFPEGIVKKYAKACNCRKPAIGLFERAIKEYKIECEKSYVIGDNVRDLNVCNFYPFHGILVGEKNDCVNMEGVQCVKSISECIAYIE